MAEEKSLESLLDEQAVGEEEPLSRRQFLAGAVVGGAVGLAAGAGTGAAVWKIADSEAQVALESAEAEIARLQGVVKLYEEMDKVGLDDILRSGMAAVALPIEAVELGAKALKGGLELAEEALRSLEEALPTARESILWLESQVSTVAAGMEKLESALTNAMEKATDTPVGAALQDFADMILDNLPFGMGDKIRDVLDGLVQLMVSVDELVEGINTLLLEPLRTKWFSTEEGEGLGSFFVNPMVENVLDPLESHLDNLAALAGTWQEQLVTPAQNALAERAELRQEIAQYKGERGLT